MAKKHTFTQAAFHAHEDGTTSHVSIILTLDPSTLHFAMELPEYIKACPLLKNPKVEAPSAADAMAQYESQMEIYSKWRLSAKAERVIWMGTSTLAGDWAEDVFGIQAQIGLGLRTVMKINDGRTHTLVIVKEDGSLGDTVSVDAVNPILLPDTPEVRAKIDALVASIKVAADLVNGIRTAADPVAYLLAIGDDWKQASGAPVADSKQAALPFDKPAAPDDDDL